MNSFDRVISPTVSRQQSERSTDLKDVFTHDAPIFVAVGRNRSYTITENGVLWHWGVQQNLPVNCRVSQDGSPVSVMEDVVFVSAGGSHTMAITSDGVLWGWGENLFGQLGDGTRYGSDGTIFTNQTIPVPILENVTYVSAGARHTMAITDDGILWGWGHNAYGQLGIGTAGYIYSEHAFVLRPVPIMENVRTVSAASSHTMAITFDEELWGWGSNRSANLGIGVENVNRDDERLNEGFRLTPILVMENVTGVSAAYTHTMAVTSDGSLWAWGGNNQGRFIDSEVLWFPAPVQIMEGIDYVCISWGSTRAVDTAGNLLAWGDNRSGRVGDGTTERRLTPVIILENIVAVSSGDGSHNFAIDSDGVLWAWGSNRNKTLGDGSDAEYRSYPIRLN